MIKKKQLDEVIEFVWDTYLSDPEIKDNHEPLFNLFNKDDVEHSK